MPPWPTAEHVGLFHVEREWPCREEHPLSTRSTWNTWDQPLPGRATNAPSDERGGPPPLVHAQGPACFSPRTVPRGTSRNQAPRARSGVLPLVGFDQCVATTRTFSISPRGCAQARHETPMDALEASLTRPNHSNSRIRVVRPLHRRPNHTNGRNTRTAGAHPHPEHRCGCNALSRCHDPTDALDVALTQPAEPHEQPDPCASTAPQAAQPHEQPEHTRIQSISRRRDTLNRVLSRPHGCSRRGADPAESVWFHRSNTGRTTRTAGTHPLPEHR